MGPYLLSFPLANWSLAAEHSDSRPAFSHAVQAGNFPSHYVGVSNRPGLDWTTRDRGMHVGVAHFHLCCTTCVSTSQLRDNKKRALAGCVLCTYISSRQTQVAKPEEGDSPRSLTVGASRRSKRRRGAASSSFVCGVGVCDLILVGRSNGRSASTTPVLLRTTRELADWAT
jgi:hypothetical protein